MPICGFECNTCKTSFEDFLPDNTEVNTEIKCPQCGSTDVIESEAASELLELINEMGRTGG